MTLGELSILLYSIFRHGSRRLDPTEPVRDGRRVMDHCHELLAIHIEVRPLP